MTQVARQRGQKAPATRRKVTVTIPEDVLSGALGQVAAGRSASLSAYVSDALSDKVAQDRGRDEYVAWLRLLDQELGPPSPEAYEWARDVLKL